MPVADTHVHSVMRHLAKRAVTTRMCVTRVLARQCDCYEMTRGCVQVVANAYIGSLAVIKCGARCVLLLSRGKLVS